MTERAPVSEAEPRRPDEATYCIRCSAACTWHQVNHCRSELIDLKTGERHWLVCKFGEHYKIGRRSK